MSMFHLRWPVLLATSLLLVATVAIRIAAEDQMLEWSVETASPEEAFLFALDAASKPNLKGFDRLDSILDKYPEYLNRVQKGTDYTLASRAAEANNDEIILYLAKRGAKLDIKDSGGFSPLHVAASKNCAAAVEALLQCGADINQLSDSIIASENTSALGIAAKCGAEGVVEVLLKHKAKLDVHPPESPNPAIHFAMRRGWELRLKLVEQRQQFHMWKPKLFADPGPLPATGNAAVIELLVKAGADLQGLDAEGEQPLHVAIRSDQLETMKVLLEKYRDKIDIEGRGHTKSIKGFPGYTPLMTAAVSANRRNTANRVAMIELLKKHGADLTVRLEIANSLSDTAYDMAVRSGAAPEVIAALKPAEGGPGLGGTP